MQEKVSPFAGTARLESLANAFGATPSWGADFYYRQQEKGTVYVAEQKGKKDEILSELPDVNLPRLWRIANLANKQDSRLLSDFNPDKFDCDDEGDCQHT